MKEVSTKQRFAALDALRGWAILAMVLSGILPFGVLPNWMYHAQLPPPEHRFNPAISGLTWVDLVFPFFLFALGAALPIALRRMTLVSTPTKRLLQRFALLAFFAFALQHIRPYALQSSPNVFTWITACVGFLLLSGVFVRLPASWPLSERRFFRVLGWAGLLTLLASLTYANGTGFSVQRKDIILLFLAHMAFWGGLVWWFTRNKPLYRLALIAGLVALRLSALTSEATWATMFWAWNPVSWLFEWEYLRYLLIVLPGTMVGDWLISVLERRSQEALTGIRKSMMWLPWLLMSVPVVVCIGLQARQPGFTLLFSLGFVGMLWWMTHRPTSPDEDFLQKLVRWGSFWLVLGLLIEPFEGGIKKDEPTYAYFWVTTGLAMLVLGALFIWMDVEGKKGGVLGLFSDNGQNPMLAYVLMGNVILPILHLVGVYGWIVALTSIPAWALVRALLLTILLAYLVRWATRKGFIWRS
ncbi:MAG TPA: DUF5009 domain-containing protein [Rhodothermales bacterium]|nr:DUF5009 domain-containing protein [Rhodothermales bacterium]